MFGIIIITKLWSCKEYIMQGVALCDFFSIAGFDDGKWKREA